ncbi:MAG: hypothetical protein JNK89_02105 [Saprospiraceae bacterium]|nr:hypothetical protein [Saprospiraceae bacterium]
MHTTTQPVFGRLAASVFLTFVVFLFLACTDGKRNIRDYYFPVYDLQKGLVYAYAAEEGDSTDRRYWFYNSFVRDSGTFLVGTQYDRYFAINQIVREKIVDNGSLARNTFLYELDTASGKAIPVRAVIESANLFPFQVTDSLGIFLYSLHYTPPTDTGATIALVRNRRFLGDGPPFQFQGKSYPTVRFGLQEAIRHNAEGSAEIEGSGEEWYAKGLGLVYFRKSFGPGGAIRYAYRLTETFSMQELERRAEEAMHSGHDH